MLFVLEGQLFAILNLLVVLAMIDKSVSDFLKEFYRWGIVVFDFCYYFVLAVHSKREVFNGLHDLFGEPFSAILFDGYHYVDFSFIGLDPVWEEQIHITNQFIVCLNKNKKSVFFRVSQPWFMILQLLFITERFWSSQPEQFLIVLEPTMVLFDIFFAVGP